MKRTEQIAELLIDAYPNRDIAEKLGINLRTVKHHMNQLFRMHDVEDGGVKRVKLAVLLYRRQLCSPPGSGASSPSSQTD